jgi:hypothetical protein
MASRQPVFTSLGVAVSKTPVKSQKMISLEISALYPLL